MFIHNKYCRWYYDIVNRAKTSVYDPSSYTERHHIIPRSLGGSNDPSNIVVLTAREHYICHLCLTKMTTGKDKRRMVFAMRMMLVKHQHDRHLRVSSRIFDSLKIAQSMALKEMWKDPGIRDRILRKRKAYWEDDRYGLGRRVTRSETSKKIWKDDARRARQSAIQKQRWKDPDIRELASKTQKRIHDGNEELRRKKSRPGKLNGMYGKTHTDDVKDVLRLKTRERLKGKTYDEIYGVSQAERLKTLRSETIRKYLAVNQGIRSGARNGNSKEYEIIDPSGIVYIIRGRLKEFCKEHRINCGKIIDLAKGRIDYYKGWKSRVL